MHAMQRLMDRRVTRVHSVTNSSSLLSKYNNTPSKETEFDREYRCLCPDCCRIDQMTQEINQRYNICVAPIYQTISYRACFSRVCRRLIIIIIIIINFAMRMLACRTRVKTLSMVRCEPRFISGSYNYRGPLHYSDL